MALTRVAPAGIGSTPGTGYVIGDSFLHSRGLNSIDANYTGIVTTQSLRVIGDLEVEGTTTTLDTALTEVDKLEVGANNNTVGVAITQSGTGDILNLYDGGTEVFSVTDGGNVKIGTETEGEVTADNLTIADAGHCGVTIRSGTSSEGNIFFSDGTSGDAEYRGMVRYEHSNDAMVFKTATVERLRIASDGKIGINSTTPGHKLEIAYTSDDDGFVINHADRGGKWRFATSGSNAELFDIRRYDGANSTFRRYLLFGPDQFSVYTGSTTSATERLRIDSAGRLGLGANNNSSYDAIAQNFLIANESSHAGMTIRSGGAGAFGAIHFADGVSDNTEKRAGRILYGHNGDFMTFYTADTDRLKIDSDGRLLTGGAVAANAWAGGDDLIIGNANSGTRSGITLVSGSDTDGGLYWSDGNSGTALFQGQLVYNHSNSRMQFYTAGSSRVTIDDVGRLLIGRTTQLASSAERLTIDSGMAMFRRNSTNAAAVYIRNEDSTADTRQPYLIFADGSGNRAGFGVQYDESSLWISGQNGIAFRTSGSAPSQNERLRITENGKIGIGQADPQGDLHIGNISGNKDLIMHSANNGNARIRFREGGSNSSGFNEYSFGMVGSGNAMTVNGQGAGEIIRIMGDTGLVGVNCTPLAQFQVKTGTNANIALSTMSTEASIEAYNDAGSANVPLRLRGQDFKFYTSSTERLRIDSSGRLLISGQAALTSTSLPHPVQIAADSNAQNIVCFGRAADDISAIDFYEADKTTNLGEIQYRRDHTNFRHRVGYISFATGGVSERLRITSGGQVNIGGDFSQTGFTANITRNASETDILRIKGNGGNAFIRFEDNDASSSFTLGADDAVGSGGFALYDRNDSAYRAVVDTNGDFGINITNPLAKLHVNLLKSSGSSTADRTKQHAAMRLSLDRTTGSMPYLGWGPALDFYSDNYDGATQRPNARIAGTISNYSAGHEGGQLRFYTTPTDTATGEGDFVERYRIESSGMIRHSGGHGNNGGNMAASAYYRIVASSTVGANANVTFVVSGLASGWMTIRGGGYSNAGQSQYALMYQLGGYMTATSTYNIVTVQEWGNGATISTQKNASDFRITIANNSSSYGLATNWIIEGSNAGIKIRT